MARKSPNGIRQTRVNQAVMKVSRAQGIFFEVQAYYLLMNEQEKEQFSDILKALQNSAAEFTRMCSSVSTRKEETLLTVEEEVNA